MYFKILYKDWNYEKTVIIIKDPDEVNMYSKKAPNVLLGEKGF